MENGYPNKLDFESGPSHFLTNDTKFLEVSKDKLTVKYTGKGSHQHDVGSIRANKPLQTKVMIAYYEITIVDGGLKSSICIGLSERELCNRQPGWEENSFGYYGEDGKKYNESTRGESYSEPFSTGDVVGCGIHYGKQEVFFTKNGKFLGIAFKKVKGIFYPAVGLHSPGEIVMANFSQKPFKFDLEGMISEQKEKIMQEVNAYSVLSSDLNCVIRSYLIHYGYEDTIKSFDCAVGMTMPSTPVHVSSNINKNNNDCSPSPIDAKNRASTGRNYRNGVELEEERNSSFMLMKVDGDSVGDRAMNSLHIRSVIRMLILRGEIDEALKFILEYFPDINRYLDAMFSIHCQQFIELVKHRKLDDSIRFAQQMLSGFQFQLSPSQSSLLQEALGLLAYEDPFNSPVSYLLQLQQRESVADLVNGYILLLELKGETQPSQSVLEILLRQLVVAQEISRERSGGVGEEFHLDTYI